MLSLRLRIVLYGVCLVLVTFVACSLVLSLTLNKMLNEQAHDIGINLSHQTAQTVQEILLLGDRLKLNLVLQDLAQNPLVGYAVVYDANNHTLAEIGTKYAYVSADDSFATTQNKIFIQKIVVQNRLIGQFHLQINTDYLQESFLSIWQNLVFIVLLMVLVAIAVGWVLGNYILNPLRKISAWGRGNDNLPDLGNRADEFSSLVTILQKRFENQSEAHPQAHKNIVGSSQAQTQVMTEARTAILVVRLGAQKQLHRLPPDKLMAIRNNYLECLISSANLYQAEIYKINNGGSVLLFHSNKCTQDYLISAICCGELIRALGHDLQIELADTGITLHLCLAVVESADLHQISEEKLVQNSACKVAILLAQQSRNLLLIDHKTGINPKAKKVASLRKMPNLDDCFCVERLHDDYYAQLEQYLHKLHLS